MNIRKNRGITLVVLVITIIIMLILAGVTVNIVVTGGILETAENAKEQVEKTSVIQKILSEIVTKQTIKGEDLNNQDKNEILSKYGTVQYNEDSSVNGVTINKNDYISYDEIVNTTTTTPTNEK